MGLEVPTTLLLLEFEFYIKQVELKDLQEKRGVMFVLCTFI